MHVVGLLIVLATVLQVKDTGKSRKRVKPVELLPCYEKETNWYKISVSCDEPSIFYLNGSKLSL